MGIRIRVIALIAVLLLPGTWLRAADDPESAAEAVVHEFNAAMSDKSIDRMVACLLEQGVQFDLRPAHADQATGSHQMVQPLPERWKSVTPILFGATQSYSRTAEIIESKVSPDIATVWARVTAVMQMPKAESASTKVFTEVYFLIRTPSGWKIGAMIDDRHTDSIATAKGG